jgi:predicted Zn-dependent protease
METEHPSNTDTAKKKARIYFTIAAIFLVAMALFWSVDASIVYVFLGAACFFLFLGFYSNPVSKDAPGSYKKFDRQEKQDVEAKPLFATSFIEKLQQKKFEFSAGRGFPSQGPGRKVVTVIVLSFFMIFMVSIMVTIFSSGGGSYDALSYYSAAEQYYVSQEYDSAYINYKRALRLDPENKEAMVGYGNVLVVRNERDSAITMFDKALEINPNYKEASYNKASALYDQKKYNEGIALLTPLIDTNPQYYEAMLLLGDCYYTQNKFDDAIPWYENAYQNGGMRSRILCHIMAFIYDSKGEYDKAIGLYQEALSYDSSIVDIYQRLGELIPGENGNFYRAKAIQLKR